MARNWKKLLIGALISINHIFRCCYDCGRFQLNVGTEIVVLRYFMTNSWFSGYRVKTSKISNKHISFDCLHDIWRGHLIKLHTGLTTDLPRWNFFVVKSDFHIKQHVYLGEHEQFQHTVLDYFFYKGEGNSHVHHSHEFLNCHLEWHWEGADIISMFNAVWTKNCAYHMLHTECDWCAALPLTAFTSTNGGSKVVSHSCRICCSWYQHRKTGVIIEGDVCLLQWERNR